MFRLSHLSLGVATICIAMQMPIVVQGDDTTLSWPGIPRLKVDFTSQEATPFVSWESGQPTDPASAAAPVVEMKKRASPSQVSDLAVTSATSGQVEANRVQLRESLLKEGQSSLTGRDSLTSELVGVIKWTTLTLILAATVVLVMKKYESRKQPKDKNQRIRVLETMQLGRNQGLKLVEVGGERFLIASDPGGIKAVTLLPSWPAMDEHDGADSNTPAIAGKSLDLEIFKGEELAA